MPLKYASFDRKKKKSVTFIIKIRIEKKTLFDASPTTCAVSPLNALNDTLNDFASLRAFLMSKAENAQKKSKGKTYSSLALMIRILRLFH